MSDQLLAAVSQYGAPALFAIVAIAAVGVPLPVTLLLIIAGSLTYQGAMNLWVSILAAGAGSVLGDQAGYAIGRWGGPALIAKLTALSGKHKHLAAFEAKLEKWGGAGIFFSRWLLTAVGPFINLASGGGGYPWPRFLFWDVLGEFTGAAIFVFLGRYFSDRVVALDAVLGDFSWAIAALVVALVLGYSLIRRLRAK